VPNRNLPVIEVAEGVAPGPGQAAILDAVPAHIALLDGQGGIASVNQAWRRFAAANGMPDPAHGVGSNYLEICEGAVGPEASEIHRIGEGVRTVLLRHQESFSVEYACDSPTEKRWFILTATPLPADGAVVMHVDISARKRAEQSMERTLERLNEAQRVGRIGDWDFDIAAGTITWSPLVFEILGRDPALGPPRNYEEHNAIYGPESRAVLADNINRAIASGDPQEYDLVAARGQGTIHVHAVAVPVKDESGRVSRIHGTVQDISARKRAQHELIQREAELQETQRLAGLGSWRLNFVEGIVRWSEETGRIFGLSPLRETSSYSDLSKLLTPASVTDIQAALRNAGEKGDRYEIELELVRSDGSRGWVLARGEPLRDTSEKVCGARGTVLDITQRKQSAFALAELSLKTAQRERILSTLLASITDFAYIYDREGRFLFVNQPLLDLWEITLDEAVGKNFSDLGFPPELAARLQREVNEVFETGDVRTGETPYGRSGLDTSYEYIFSPVIGAEGAVEFVVGSTRNISERKRAAAMLQESEGRYRAVVDWSPESLSVTHDGTILFVNPATVSMMGAASENDLVGKSIFDFVHPDSRSLARERIEINSACGGALPMAEEQLIKLDGTVIDVEIQGRSITYNGEPAMISSIRDVTERKRAEDELRASTQKFYQLANNITDAFWIRSANMQEVHYVSPAFERIWGRSVESLYARPQDWVNFIVLEDRKRVQIAFAALTADTPALDIEYRIARPDGEIRWLRARGFQVRDDDGTLIRNIGIVTDITDEQIAAEALRSSEWEQRQQAEELEIERSRLVAAQKVAKVGSWETDLASMSVRWSEETHRIFETDALQPATHDAFLALVHPDDRSRVARAFTRSVAHRRASSIEHRLLLADGRIKFVEERWEVVFGAHDQPLRAIGTCQDVTEHRHTADALHESEKRLRDVFDGLGPSLFVALLTPAGILVEVNRSPLEAVGLTAGDVLGMRFEETHWWTYSPEVQQQLREAIVRAANGESVRYDVRNRGAGDEVIDIDFVLEPLRDAKGDVVFLVASGSVITERKIAEDALRQAQKMEAVGQLAAGVAHEFNNLLQALTSTSAIIRFRAPTDAIAKIGTDLESLIKRGAGLTQQLLIFSRNSAIEKAAVELGWEIQKASTLLRQLMPETIAIVLDIASEPLNIQGDAGQIQQILLNLAINARDAMPAGGTLTLRAGRIGDEVFQEVEDTGHGMTAATQAHLFEPFFSTKDPGKGTGLGLAVAHGIVEQHGGRFEVHSSPGAGSRFRVILPASLHETKSVTQPVVEAPIPRGAGRILLVEDDPSVRAGIATLLDLMGYEVTAAASAEQAIALAMTPPPDILLSDVTLPGMTGPVLAGRLRQCWPQLNVILMSGYFEPAMQTQASEEGWRFLQKPFELDDLAKELRVAMSEGVLSGV
jgi:PAS domain S-box-containing protein